MPYYLALGDASMCAVLVASDPPEAIAFSTLAEGGGRLGMLHRYQGMIHRPKNIADQNSGRIGQPGSPPYLSIGQVGSAQVRSDDLLVLAVIKCLRVVAANRLPALG